MDFQVIAVIPTRIICYAKWTPILPQTKQKMADIQPVTIDSGSSTRNRTHILIIMQYVNNEFIKMCILLCKPP